MLLAIEASAVLGSAVVTCLPGTSVSGGGVDDVGCNVDDVGSSVDDGVDTADDDTDADLDGDTVIARPVVGRLVEDEDDDVDKDGGRGGDEDEDEDEDEETGFVVVPKVFVCTLFPSSMI